MTWTAQETECLKALWNEGHIGHEIALLMEEKFGRPYTRNAVIGKADRLALCHRRAPRANAGRPRKRPDPVLQLVKARPRALSAAEVPAKQRKTFFQLRPCDCRWPYGEVGTPGFFFCGLARESLKPYCPAHVGLSVRGG